MSRLGVKLRIIQCYGIIHVQNWRFQTKINTAQTKINTAQHSTYPYILDWEEQRAGAGAIGGAE